MEVIFLKPIQRPAIWGGRILKEYFDYSDFNDDIGQAWLVSAQNKENSSIILNGEYKNKTLLDLWNDKPEYFNSKYDNFPYIVGILAPIDDLSIQIHPNDEYARRLGHKFGKNEAWYFFEVFDEEELILGTNTNDLNEIKEMIKNDKWDDLIKKIPIKKDDFINIQAGTLHALPKNVIVYEVQRGSDITYRFYDYKRKDRNGNERELHIDKAIECLNLDADRSIPNRIIEENDNYIKTTFISNNDYTIYKLDIKGRFNYPINNYEILTCIKGKGLINNQEIKKGDTCLVPTIMKEIIIEGDMTILGTKE